MILVPNAAKYFQILIPASTGLNGNFVRNEDYPAVLAGTQKDAAAAGV